MPKVRLDPRERDAAFSAPATGRVDFGVPSSAAPEPASMQPLIARLPSEAGPSATRPATFESMSMLTREEYAAAAVVRFDRQGQVHALRVTEDRPWGQLEWSAAATSRSALRRTWSEPVLQAVTIHNLFSDTVPDVLRRGDRSDREQRLMVHVLGYETSVPRALSAVGGLSLGLGVAGAVDWPIGIEMPGMLACAYVASLIPEVLDALRWRGRRRALHTSRWLRDGREEEPARRFTADDHRFHDLRLLVAAMRQIEEATAHRRLPANLCSPAWVTFWFATGMPVIPPLIPTPAMERMAAAWQAARHALQVLSPAEAGHLTDRWTDRTWLQATMGPAAAYAELARVAELISGRRTDFSVDSATWASDPAVYYGPPSTKLGQAAVAAAISTAPLPAAPRIDLEPVRLVHQEVRDAFTAFCFDPHAVLARPLLNDVSDDLTAAFYTAQEVADEAETALQGRPDDAALARAYEQAVHTLASAWDAADIHARECGVSHLTSAEQNDVRKARRTLDLALNPNTPAGERDAAYRAVLALISGLVKVPAPATARMTAQIENVQRLQLGASCG